MTRFRSRIRLLGACALPLLVGLGLTTYGCSSDSDKDDGTAIKDVQKIVYIVKQHTYTDADGNVSVNVAGGMGQVMDYLRYVPGARIEVRDLSSGDVKNVISDFPNADVSSLDVSFDATKIVFSMKQSGDDSYHIYWADLATSGDGKFEIHQVTFGPQDDVYPVYLAGDKIGFVTNLPYTEAGTGSDEYNHANIVTQIGFANLAGDVRLCSRNLSHTINLFSMADGRVGYSRWEHLGPVNDVKMFALNPDCTQMVAIAGQHGKPGNSLVQVSETGTPNVFLGITTSRENTIQSGALIRIDARSPVNPGHFYEEDPQYDNLTPTVPTGEEASPVGRYRYPTSLPDGRVLVSWSGQTWANEINELSLTPPDFGVYVYDTSSRTNQLVVNYEDTWEVYARPLVKRPEPPNIGSIQNTEDTSVAALFGSIDVRQTSLFDKHGNRVSGAQFDDTPLNEALNQAAKVRIIEGFSSESAPGVTMFGLTMHEGAAILGEADVYADGSWLAAIPPYVPVHLQPLDEFDLSIRNQLTWLQGMPGEDRVCGGCHEDRNEPFDPGGQQLTIAAGKGAQNFNVATADRMELPWDSANAGFEANEMQALLTAKCADCHNASTTEYYSITMTNEITGTSEVYQVPRLDLSDTPVTVYYDMQVETYPASYVSIFYPAALEMEMDEATITGTIPPKWGVPGSARTSALIEKINMTSFKDQNKMAWTLGEAFSDPNIKGGTRTMHPEDKGVTLTREERQMLIRAIDLGGQYYARQNTAYQPYGNDPLKGSGTQY